MGLDLGDLEEYGFSKTAQCGKSFCAPDSDKFQKNAGQLIDRFADSMKNQYEVAMCHPVLAPYRPRVEIIWNYWPLSFIFSLKWRVVLNTITC